MNAKKPYHFKVLRYIHDSFTGEFLNIGLIVYSEETAYFKARLLQKYSRITGAFPSADGEYYRRYISSLQNKFNHLSDGIMSQQHSLLEKEELEKQILKILPHDDSSIQFGPVQGGITEDIDDVFDDLYHRLIETYIDIEDKSAKTEQDIWNLFSRPLRSKNVLNLLRNTVIQTPKLDIELDHAWKNGKWKAIQPISFDLQHAGSINNKAKQWFGNNVLLNASDEIGKIYCLIGKPRAEDSLILKAYTHAKDLLSSKEYCHKVEVIEEENHESFADEISSVIEEDTKIEH